MLVIALLLTGRVFDEANKHLVAAAIRTVEDTYAIKIQARLIEPDIVHGRLEAYNISAVNLDKTPLLNASRLTVLFPLPWSARPNVRIVGDTVSSWVRRQKDGKYEFERFIPPPTEKPSETPIEVFVTNASAVYTDDSGEQPARGYLSRATVGVQTIGDQGHVAVAGELEDLGSVHTAVRWAKGAGSVRVNASQVMGKYVLPILHQRFSIKELAPRQFANVHGSAVVGVVWGKTTTWLFSGDLKADRASYGEYKATNVSAKVAGSADGWSFDTKGVTEQSPFTALGSIWLGKQAQMVIGAKGSGSEVRRLWKYVGSKNASPVRGPFTADVVILGEPSKPFVAGTVAVQHGKWENYDASDLRGTVQFAFGRSVSIRAATGDAFGSHVAADLDFDLRTKILRAVARAPSVRIEQFEQLAKEGLSGHAALTALIEGPLDSPYVSANIAAPDVHLERTISQDRPEWKGDIGALLARAVWSGDKVEFPVVRLASEMGDAQASGSYDMKTGDLNFAFDLNGITLEALQPTYDLGGLAFAKGEVSGTASDPQVHGWLESYTPRYEGHQISLASGEFTYRNDTVQIETAQLRDGISNLGIHGELDIRDGVAIARDVLVNVKPLDFQQALDEADMKAPLYGFATGTFTVSGPLDDLAAQGTLKAHDVFLDQLVVDSMEANLAFANKRLTIRGANAQLGTGAVTVTGFAEGDIARIDVALRNAELDILSEYMPPALPVDGDATGDLRFERNGDATSATASATISGAKVANLVWGDGAATAHLVNGIWSGDLTLVSPERSASATVDSYDSKANRLSASVVARASVPDVRAIARRLSSSTDPDVWRVTSQAEGEVTVTAQVLGPMDDLSFPFSAEVAGLEINEQALGSVTASGTAREDLYKFDEVKWSVLAGSLTASGSYVPQGDVTGTVEIANFPAQVVGAFVPSARNLEGQLDATAQISGLSERPDIDMSATVTNLGRGGEDLDSATFALIKIRDGAIETDGGVVQEQGYVARLSGRVPFRYQPFGIPRDEPISADLTLPEQSLDGLRVFMPSIDPDRTSGTISGPDGGPIRVSLAGTADQLQLNGGARLTGESLALKDVQEHLKNVAMRLRFTQDRVVLEDASASTSSGGLLTATASAAVNDGLDSPITGKVKLDRLVVKNSDPSAKKRLTGVLDGSIDIGGTLFEPSLKGTIDLGQGDAWIPEGWQSSTGGLTGDFNPSFDLKLNIARGTTLRNSRLEAKVEGQVALTQTLAEPKLAGQIAITSGTMRLPTARLSLQPGSTINISYVSLPEAEPIAEVRLDIDARTNLVALNALGTPTPYRIDLHITGSLLSEDGLQMRASSSPPDLTEQQILALLGHTSFFENVQQGNLTSGLQDELKDIFGATVLPAIFDRVAEQIGLESLSLSYNRYEPLTLNVSKSLFDGFSIAYRRELEGILPRYEVKLLWQLPLRQRFFRHISLGFSYDEQREYRISLEWGTRF